MSMQTIGDLAETVVRRIDDLTWNGQGPISRAGVYKDISLDDYHNNVDLLDGWSISPTGLKRLIDRPSAYWCRSPYNEARIAETPSSALNFGKIAHAIILGDEDLGGYVLQPKELNGEPWNGRTKICREWKAKQIEAGKVIVEPKDLEAVNRIADNLRAHPMIQAGILNGKAERSMFAKFGNIWLRSRPDVVPTNSGDFSDLKTTSDISTDGLYRSMFQFGYHIAAAVCRMVCRELYGPDYFQSFSFVFVEKSAPFDVRVMQLEDEDIDRGEMQVKQALKVLEDCKKTGFFYGYDGPDRHVDWIGLPGFARTRISTELEAA